MISGTSQTALIKLASQMYRCFADMAFWNVFCLLVYFDLEQIILFWKKSRLPIIFYPFTLTLKPNVMSIVKVIEVIASSEKSFDDAVQNALTEASKSVKNIDSIYVKHFKAKVEDNRVVSYGVNAKISFKVSSRDID